VPDDEDGRIGDDRRDRVIDVKRVRRCVGDPPRQTEDPQSPPCINYFEGDNGGATARGVTRDEIRVAVPFGKKALFDSFLPHFNSRYEFYGRKLRLVEMTVDAPAASADEAGVFAAVPPGWDGDDDEDDGRFSRDTARRGIVSVTGQMGVMNDEPDLRAAAPYAWAFRPTSDYLQRALGSLACSSLAGRLARFAAPAYRGTIRKFGIVVTPRGEEKVDVRPLQDTLARCEVTARVYEIAGNKDDTTTMRFMAADNVTSALVVADAYDVSNEMLAASRAGYQPEWIVAGTDADDELQWAAVPPEQRSGLFGIAPFNKLLPPQDEPYSWAMREGGATGPDPNYRLSQHVAAYQTLLLLASGIQTAGPGLTAADFARGLHATRFPNPGHAAAPYYQAHVGFAPGDFAMVDDVAITWWSEAAPAYRNQLSATSGWCYVGRGVRFGPATIPDVESALFDPDPGACR
jgi:hypothetical protein